MRVGCRGRPPLLSRLSPRTRRATASRCTSSRSPCCARDAPAPRPRRCARRLRLETLEARVSLAEQETLRRVAEERLRIAREVHDVVGHGLATITLRAGVADRLADRDPAEVRTRCARSGRPSKDSLAELSALLGLLRDEATPRRRARAGAGPAGAAAPRRRPARRRHGGRARRRRRGAAGACPRSCRRRLPHRPGGADQRGPPRRPRRDARACASRGRDGVVEVEVRDDGRGAAGAGPPPAAGCRACASARPRWAGASRPAPRPSAASGSWAVAARGPALIRVVLADDQALVRAGLRALLDAEDDLEVVGEAATATRPSPSRSPSGPTSC